MISLVELDDVKQKAVENKWVLGVALLLLAGFAASGLFSTVSTPTFKIGETVEQELSVSSNVDPDWNKGDGDIRYIYGKYAVLEGGSVVDESEWSNLSQSKFSHTFSRSFDSSGEKAYLVVLAEAESHYNFTTETWSDFNISEIDRAEYKFEVQKISTSPGTPDKSQLDSFFSNLLGFLQDLLGFV